MQNNNNNNKIFKSYLHEKRGILKEGKKEAAQQ